jgi:predicted alpha/beta hydrolase family esterase
MIQATNSGAPIASRLQRPALRRPPILIVPGLFNSAPDHWQSHWERTLPEAERVEQSDWERPTLGEWTAGLAEAIRKRPGAVLVAHSLGCALVAHYTRISRGRGVGGALLVAPADVNRSTAAGQLLQGFSPIPLEPLPYPSAVVASHDDPYVSIDWAGAFARAWGSSFVDLGRAGHINAESGHGPWPEGLDLLDALIARVAGAQADKEAAWPQPDYA